MVDALVAQEVEVVQSAQPAQVCVVAGICGVGRADQQVADELAQMLCCDRDSVAAMNS